MNRRVRQSPWHALAVLLVMLVANGCHDARPRPLPPVGDGHSRRIPAHEPRLLVDNMTAQPQRIMSGPREAAIVPPWSITRVPIAAGKVALAVEGATAPHSALQLRTERGRVYVWDLTGTAQYEVATWHPDTRRLIRGRAVAPSPTGVHTFGGTGVVLDLLDPLPAATAGAASPAVRKLLRLEPGFGGEPPAGWVERATGPDRAAWPPDTVAGLLSRLAALAPHNWRNRLLAMLDAPPPLDAAVVAWLEANPQPAMAPSLRARVMTTARGAAASPALSRITRALAACTSDAGLRRLLDALAGRPAARDAVLRGLAGSRAHSALELFVGRLGDPRPDVRAHAWSQVLGAAAIRRPGVWQAARQALAMAWYLPADERLERYQQLVRAARAALTDAPGTQQFELAQLALDHPSWPVAHAGVRDMATSGEPGLAVLHARYAGLDPPLQRAVVRHVAAQPEALTPSGLAILDRALDDLRLDVRRTAFGRLADPAVIRANRSIRARLAKGAVAMRDRDMRADMRAIFDDARRRAALAEWGDARTVALAHLLRTPCVLPVLRHAMADLRRLLPDSAWRAELRRLAADLPLLPPDNRALALEWLAADAIDHRDPRDRSALSADAVRERCVSALDTVWPEVRQTAFRLLTGHEAWFASEGVRTALVAALARERDADVRSRQSARLARATAVQAAAQFDADAPDAALVVLTAALESDAPDVARVALLELAAIPHPAARAVLHDHVRRIALPMQAQMLDLLAGAARNVPWDLFEWALADDSPRLREAAFVALATRARAMDDARARRMCEAALERETSRTLAARLRTVLGSVDAVENG